MAAREIGVVGLGTIGGGLARNFASRDVHVAVYNRTFARTEEFIAEHGADGAFTVAKSLEDFARLLKPPRAVAVLVNAGRATDEVIDGLVKVLARGDTIIDGGNSFFQDTRRRAAMVEGLGL
ncbi:MAG TPA: NAD(P)-binding domain-containing protein, partial [Candidatus Dormibacteraeota bacterium]|nr:NAD(P)-binding domain-containing protein [Candidatus Dormibacteraeota bacterium]